MSKRKVLIIGGGPAGMMAAGQAARAGAEVRLYEKMKHPGLKLGITGKGRGNLTNIAEKADFIAHFGRTGKFLHQAFGRFFNTELMEFLEDLGLKLAVERGGRVFPTGGRATEVRTVLQHWIEAAGVRVSNRSPVDELAVNQGQAAGIVVQGKTIPADAVILATGGASYPLTGSTGDGYRLAKAVGHRIIPIRPALVPLETAGPEAGRMAGLNLRNIKVKMLVEGKKQREAFGEVVFTSFGLSGPVVLTLSGAAVDAKREGKKVDFSLDLKPALDEQKLEARLLRDFTARSNEPLSSVLRGLLPREMVPVCLELTGISPDRLANGITVKERRRLRTWLKDFRLEMVKARPLEEAIITAGGVDTREIDPRSMESRLVKGLYFAGEVLDLQADTGGYNLQAAFSTGWLAGRAAAGGKGAPGGKSDFQG